MTEHSIPTLEIFLIFLTHICNIYYHFQCSQVSREFQEMIIEGRLHYLSF